MKRYKRHRDYGFFDQDIRLSKLSQLGDPLEKLNSGVDFEIFRPRDFFYVQDTYNQHIG
jgi:hypothetical protein